MRLKVPTYMLVGWDLTNQSTYRLRFRPNRSFVIHRVMMALLPLLMAGLLTFTYFGLVNAVRTSATPQLSSAERAEQSARDREAMESIRGIMTPTEVDQVERRLQDRRADREAAQRVRNQEQERRLGYVTLGFYALLAALVIWAILPLVSLLWTSITLERDARNHLRVRDCGLWARTRSWPINHLTSMAITTHERYGRRRYGGYRFLGWDWVVNVPSTAIAHGGTPGPAFVCLRQKEAPTALGESKLRVPKPVQDFVRAVHGLTGVGWNAPQMAPWGERASIHTIRGPVERHVLSHVSGTLEDAPPDVRERLQPFVDQYRAQGKTGEIFMIREGGGEPQTYTSIEDMPAELREQFRRMREES